MACTGPERTRIVNALSGFAGPVRLQTAPLRSVGRFDGANAPTGQAIPVPLRPQ